MGWTRGLKSTSEIGRQQDSSVIRLQGGPGGTAGVQFPLLPKAMAKATSHKAGWHHKAYSMSGTLKKPGLRMRVLEAAKGFNSPCPQAMVTERGCSLRDCLGTLKCQPAQKGCTVLQDHSSPGLPCKHQLGGSNGSPGGAAGVQSPWLSDRWPRSKSGEQQRQQ